MSSPLRAPEDAPSLARRQALHGTAWTLLGYGGTQVLRLGSNLVLAYLLFPEAFGIMALVNVFLVGMEMFSDFGVWRSCIQNPRGNDPQFLGTAFTIQAVRGVAIWGCTCLLAWPYARFYGEPVLVPYLAIVGINSALRGFESTRVYTLNRELAVRPLTLLELGARGVQAVVMLGWAWLRPEVWALVAGGVAYGVVRLIGSHVALGGPRARFAWEPGARRELLRFGKWILGSSIVVFLTANADRLILGKFLTTERLGIYSIAFGYSSMVVALVTKLADTVLFPLLARAQAQPRQMMQLFLEARRLVLWAALGLCVAMLVGAPLFFELAYDPRYREAGTLVQWLVPLVWSLVMGLGLDLVPLSLGRSDVQFYANFVRSSGVILAMGGWWLAGLPGLIGGLSVAPVLRQLYLVAGLPLGRAAVLGQSLRTTLGLVASGGLGLVVVELVDGLPRLAQMLSVGALTVLVVGITAGFVGRWIRRRRAPGPGHSDEEDGPGA
ncbi:MAG: oligosaccharide flippase family protein [Nannocystaceae bacterium]